MVTETAAPEWFTSALAQVADEGKVTVHDAVIRYRAWGPSGESGVVLVHGGAAHSHWWDHIAPLLADGTRVVAVDLSGHGDSDRREKYNLDLWSDEATAVAKPAGIAGPPLIIGHSLGGQVALRAGARHGDGLRGVVAIDSPVRDLTPEELAARDRQAFGPLRVYPTVEEAVGRFRTMPPQETLPYVLAHVATHSVQPVDGGWSWKFDPQIFDGNSAIVTAPPPVRCPTLLMPAQFGLFAGERTGEVLDLEGRPSPSIEIPDAAHHVMLDSPVALIACLRTLIAVWNG